jgi:hypothetical protein
MKAKHVSWHWGLVIPATAIAIMVLGWPFVPDYDIFLHLKMGELIVQMKQIITEDILTFTALGEPEETHSWMSQILFWAVHSQLGRTGLYLLNIVLVWSTLFLCHSYVFARTKHIGFSTLVVSLAVLIHHRMQILRPMLIGEFLFAVLMFKLLVSDRFSSTKLLATGALVGFWANLHGSVIIALPIALLFSFSHGIAALFPQGKKPGALRERLLERWPALFTPVAVFLGISLNPMGPGFFSYVREVSRIGNVTVNSEWLPVTLPSLANIWEFVDIITLVLLLGAVAWFAHLILERKSERGNYFFSVLVNLFFLALPFVSYRHCTYLLFTLPFYSSWLWERFAPRFRVLTSRSHVMTLAYCGMAILFLLGSPFYESGGSVENIERATQFLKDVKYQGNIYNYPTWGNYLTYSLYPQIRVAADQRTWVNRRLHLLWHESKKYGPRERVQSLIQNFPGGDLVFFPSKLPLPTILDESEWLLVYENDSALIALRKNSIRAGENLGRITDYYRRQNVPFDPQTGFNPGEAYAKNPKWYLAQQELENWGKWPHPFFKHQWASTKNAYFASRKIPLQRVP